MEAVLPCISWVISSGTQLSAVFIVMYAFGLLWKVMHV